MRFEPFVFLGIVLLVWLLSSIGSWLRQELERRSWSFQASESPGELLPSHDADLVVPEEAAQGMREEPVAAPRIVASGRRRRSASGRVRYRSPKAVREGVVMMTVFGSCKALEPPQTSWLRDC